MITLRWITSENVQCRCEFKTEKAARAYWHEHRLMSDPNIVSVWINDQQFKTDPAWPFGRLIDPLPPEPEEAAKW